MVGMAVEITVASIEAIKRPSIMPTVVTIVR
jgi:hypothetical protein